jgi:hypothetical protein
MIFIKPKERETDSIPLGEWLTYGVSPLDRKGSGTQQAQSILPGDSIELSLNDKSYEAIGLELKKLKYPESIEQIEFSIQEVGFEDGAVWSGGEIGQHNKEKSK